MSIDDVVLYSTLILVFMGVCSLSFTVGYQIKTHKKLINDVDEWIVDFYNNTKEWKEDTDNQNHVMMESENGKDDELELVNNDVISQHPLLSV